MTSAVDRAPLTALEAVSAGLITGAKYEDEASAIATAAEGRSPERPLKKIPYKRLATERAHPEPLGPTLIRGYGLPQVSQGCKA